MVTITYKCTYLNTKQQNNTMQNYITVNLNSKKSKFWLFANVSISSFI